MKMRGHDLTSPAAKTSNAVPGKQTTASPHAKPIAPPKPVYSPAQIAKQKREDEIWKSEQAMKKVLDASVEKKGSNLWKQTVDVVHKNDPNAKIIHSLEVSAQHGPSHAPKATTDRSPHPATSDSSMAAAMKKDLDSKVGTDIHSQWKTDQKKEQAGFSKTTKAFKVAETAQAHSSMPLGDMKHILKNQLDNSVSSVVKRAKQLQSFNSDKQLKARLKAELDSKTKIKQKKLLQLEALKNHLHHERHGLSGKVTRAEKVREQLTKEMKEENAIRSQLDKSAKKQGQAMLHKSISNKGSKSVKPHKLTKADLENQLRAQLRGHEKQTAQRASKVAEAKHSLLKKALANGNQLKPGGGLEKYLRNQLETSDHHRASKLYQHSVQGNLLKRVEKMVVNKDQSITSKNKAIQQAEMRLFKESMHGAERREAEHHAQQANSKDDDAILTKERSLLHKAMQLQPKAAEPKAVTEAATKEDQVMNTENKIMAKTMHSVTKSAASAKAKPFQPFAHLHALEDNGVVHDMAHANSRLTHSLGHTKALGMAKQASDEIKAERKRMVNEAQHDLNEAVE